MTPTFPELKNDLFIKALKRESIQRTPVWMMRQAGRYLPEYRKVRQQAGSFMDLCRNTELACEVTLQPLRRYKIDAAILFSDILTIPDALGLGLYFETGEGPKFKRTILADISVDELDVIDTSSDLDYVYDAVNLIRKELAGSVPLIGFSGSPWTLATYMIEGQGSKTFAKAKSFLYQRPEEADLLLDKLAQSVAYYLGRQIRAGAQAVQIFDSWGGALSAQAYQRFSLKPMRKVMSLLQEEFGEELVPTIAFTKGGGLWLQNMRNLDTTALGVDWTIELSAARRIVGDKCALQGNLDPAILLTNPDTIRTEVAKVLASYGHGSGHVFNLGHGITPEVPPDNAKSFFDAVHELSPAYHK